jgi:hypothetical protein
VVRRRVHSGGAQHGNVQNSILCLRRKGGMAWARALSGRLLPRIEPWQSKEFATR